MHRPPHRPRRRALPRGRCGSTPACEAACASSSTSRRFTSRSRWPRSTPSASALPGLPAVACFDTAFHATLPAAAHTYALPGAVARALGTTPLRLSRPLARLGRAARARAHRQDSEGSADRQLPPRRRRVAVRDRRRHARRHDDGLHAARGPRDGDALGQRRSRAAAVAAGARASCRVAELAKRSSTARVCSVSPAAPTCARSLERAVAGDAPARLALDVYVHRLRARDRRDGGGTRRPRRARVHRRRRRALARGARRQRPRARRSSASQSTTRATVRHTPTSEIGADGAAVRALVLTAREDFEIARQVRAELGRPAPMQG